MATQYVTLKSSDDAYSKYLWGNFAKDKVALPVKSYNLGTSEESVTFEIKNKNEVEGPGPFVFVSSFVKFKSYIIILMPLFFTLAKNYNQSNFDFISFLSATVALVLLFAGFNIRNDVDDHISGYDRVNLNANKKPIGMGWTSATQSKKISNILIATSALVAVPSLLLNPKLVSVLTVVLVFFLLGRLAKNNSYKNQHFSEIVLLILVGPALLTGLQLATSASLNEETLVFGIMWGLFVLLQVQVNNFLHIMTSSQHRIRNTITKLGFDRTKVFLALYWLCILILWITYHQAYVGGALGGILSIIFLIYSFSLMQSLKRIKSPMGSSLMQFKEKTHRLYLVAVFVLFLESLQLVVLGG